MNDGEDRDDGDRDDRFRAPDRGAWTLTAVDARDGDRVGGRRAHVLTLHEHRRATRWMAAATGAAVGLLALGGACVALLPVHGAPDGLTPTRGDFFWCALTMGGAVGAVLGGASAWWLARLRESRTRAGGRAALSIELGDHVYVDGMDAGELVAIEAHPASAILVVVTEREELRVELADEREAAALRRALERRGVGVGGAGDRPARG